MSQTLDDYRAAIGEHFSTVRITTLDYLSPLKIGVGQSIFMGAGVPQAHDYWWRNQK